MEIGCEIRSTAAADRFVDVLGLKSVFAAFMGKIHKTSVRKLEPDEKHDEETRAVSVLASLFTGTFFSCLSGPKGWRSPPLRLSMACPWAQLLTHHSSLGMDHTGYHVGLDTNNYATAAAAAASRQKELTEGANH